MLKTAAPDHRVRRVSLYAGSALAAVLALSSPVQAHALSGQEPDEGVVVIRPEGDAAYEAPEQGIDREGHQNVGVLVSAGGSATVDVGAVTTWGDEAHGIVAFSDQGDTTVRADQLRVDGQGAWAVSAVSNHGDVTVDVGDVIAAGPGSIGVRAIAYEGDIDIDADFVAATSDATAVEVVNIAEDGVTNVRVGRLDATRGARGVVVEAVNAISVETGNVMLVGDNTVAISTFSEKGLTTIRSDELHTEGTAALGILAQSLTGDIDIEAGVIRTSGQGSDAVYAVSLEGDLRIRLQDVATEGVSAYGLYALAYGGSADVQLGTVTTSRDLALGASVAAGRGVRLQADSILTSGYAAFGLGVLAGDELYGTHGDAVVRANRIETRGLGAVGAAVTAYGNVDLGVGSVLTIGDEARGLVAFARDGDVKVAVNEVRTQGTRSIGVDASVQWGDMDATIGKITTTGENAGGTYLSSYGGSTTARIGEISTTGYNSTAATLSARDGDITVAAGRLSTTGEFAAGLRATGSAQIGIEAADIKTVGDTAVGIEAVSGHWTFGLPQVHRSIDITAGSISTEGARSHGIFTSNTNDLMVFGDAVAPLTGPRPTRPLADPTEPADLDTRIRAGVVTTKGEGAVGILVAGAADVSIEADSVVSEQDRAISVVGREDISLKTHGLISGGTIGAELTGENVSVSVAKTSLVTGATDAMVLAAVGPYVPPAEPWAALAPAPGVVTVDNAGTIRAGTGSAIRVTSGAAVINNSGIIEGALTLSDGDDQVTNTGQLVMTADNDFGAGTDLFTNKGTVSFGKAAAPQRFAFLGLERFANDGGLIDLRNERAGDVLTLSGGYAATGNARLALDVDGEAVDSLTVGGAVTGRTSILLQSLKPEDAVLLDGDAKLITVGAGTKADAFSLADGDLGLIRYDLTFDEKTRTFMLGTSAGLSVHQGVRAIEGLRFAWRASAEAFGSEQAMARAAGGDGGRVWVVAHGANIGRDADDAEYALGYDQELVGGQMGASFGASAFAGGQAVYGLTTGYTDSTLSYEGAGAQAVDMRTFNLGAYGAWRREQAFATALVKVDSHSLKIDDAAAGFETEADGLTWGARVEAGYRFDLGGIALEPVVGLDYLNTTLDDLGVLGQSVAFDDQQGFSARIGAQALTRHELAEGRAVQFSTGLELVHDFDAEQSGALHSNDEVDVVTLAGPETYGRALIGAQLDVGGGLQTYVQGEGRFGDGQSGGGLRIGARYRF